LRRADNLPTAVFACDFNMAEATLAVLDRYRIAVPGQVSVIGFDDSEAAAQHDPPLTVLRQPVLEMGARAVEKLLEAFRQTEARSDVARSIRGTERFPCELIVRGSTAAPIT
jgi:LacI family transcriptional regulator